MRGLGSFDVSHSQIVKRVLRTQSPRTIEALDSSLSTRGDSIVPFCTTSAVFLSKLSQRFTAIKARTFNTREWFGECRAESLRCALRLRLITEVLRTQTQPAIPVSIFFTVTFRHGLLFVSCYTCKALIPCLSLWPLLT